MTYAETYITETTAILAALDTTVINHIVDELVRVKDSEGRVFCVGVGGSAATASHLVNDLRKICKIESYCGTDNVAELTARTNDDGWGTTFVEWLRTSRIDHDDALFVLSVGGGRNGTSANIVRGVEHARLQNAGVVGVVGRDGGYTATHSTACLVIPPLYKARITSHTEGLASVICHLIISDPRLTR